MNRRQRLILAGIVILAVILRCIFINTRNIQYDDAFSYFLARASIDNIIRGTAADTMPPLFYFILHFWQMVSDEIWFLRLLSVFLSLGALLFLFGLVKNSISITAGLWAALFAVISPLQIYHAQDIRMYALFACCGMGYLYFFFQLWNDDLKPTRKTWKWVGLILFGASAMYTHNLAVFCVLSPVIFVVMKRDWKFLWKYILALFIIALTTAPWLIMVPGQVQKIQNAFWTPRPGIVEVMQSIMLLTFNLPESNKILFFGGAILAAYIFILVIYRLFRNLSKAPNLLLLTAISFFPPLLLFLLSYLIRPVFVIRGFIPSQMAFLGLTAAIAALDWKIHLGKILAGLVILNAVISYPALFSYSEFPRSPFARASIQIHDAVKDDFFIVHDNKLSFFPIHYYFPSTSQVFLKDQPGTANDTFATTSQEAMEIFPVDNIDTASTGRNKLVYIVFREAAREYEEQNQPHPVISWLKSNFTLTEEKSIGDLKLLYFERDIK